MPEPIEKLDFNNLDVRLYLCLKAAVLELEDFAKMGGVRSVHMDQLKLARETLHTFEQSAGPIPDWAVGRNFGYELVAGAQLCTKDGRRIGNAHIVQAITMTIHELADRQNPFGEFPAYVCLTDAGCKFTMRENELLGYFNIGEWLSDPARVIRDFDHSGEFVEEPK